MFATDEAFSTWLQSHAPEALNDTMVELDGWITSRLRDIYQDYGRQTGSLDMLRISSALGNAIPLFMQVANAAGGQLSNPEKKTFVVDNSLALFRLLNGGVAGNQQGLSGSDADTIFQGADMEEVFVRPMAEQAIEQAYDMWRTLGATNSGSESIEDT
jgi:hypothetical protein